VSALLIIPALICGWMGSNMLTMATDIAIRRKTNVWTASRPEFGAALLAYAMAFLFAMLAGGHL
jgi:hypothetical protein